MSALVNFCRRLGLPPHILSRELDNVGAVAMEWRGRGLLCLEREQGELLLYLARPCPHYLGDTPERLLRLSGAEGMDLPLQGGLMGGQMVLITRVEEGGCSLEEAARFLENSMDRL